ncbi:MAG: DUF1073 domain-containing protein, partial [Leptolyngbyaceae cyanobacterium MO_188.B28]|nr:DUF1073 domain-containing protein [Leptolyngbyaceae cyanobacterium MO_188.B28]
MSELIRLDEIAAELRQDGLLQNLATGMGDPQYDRTLHTQLAPYRYLYKRELEGLYRGWLCRKVVDLYPKEATRKWLEIKLGGKASDRRRIDSFNKYQEKLGVAQAIKRASTWARLYGGAAIIAIVEDGQTPDKPIRANRIRSIRKLMVLDGHKIRPWMQPIETDPLDPEFYELILPPRSAHELRQSMGQDARLGTGAPVHKSRVFRFDGVELPPDMLLLNHGWGLSVLDLIWDAFNRWELAQNSAVNALETSSFFTYALDGLRELLAENNERNRGILRNRIQSMWLSMNNRKVLVHDAAKEKVGSLERRLNQMPDMLDRFQGEIIAATDYPATVLFGKGPVGLASQGTGEAEEKVWAKLVGQFQAAHYSPILRAPGDDLGIFELIWLAKDGPTYGREPDDWSFDWNSLIELGDEEKLSVREKQANIDRTYVDLEILLKDEVRQSRFGGSDYSIETELDEDLWKQKQEEEANQFGGFEDYGFGGYEEPQAVAPAQGETGAIQPAQPPDSAVQQDSLRSDRRRLDTAVAPKWIMRWQGIEIGITHFPGDLRHNRPMRAGYGFIRGSYGDAEDGMAIDVYIGRNLSSEKVYRIAQVKPDELVLDEYKWVIGVNTPEQARALYLQHMPRKFLGMVEASSLKDLAKYRRDAAELSQSAVNYRDRADDARPCNQCLHWRGDSRCGLVAGEISALGSCDRWERPDDPKGDGASPGPTSPLAVVEPELDREDAGDHYWVNNPKVRNGGYYRRRPQHRTPRIDGSALLSDSFNFDAEDEEPDPADLLR